MAASSALPLTPVTMADAVALTDAFLDLDTPVFVWGLPGIGKSDLPRALAKRRQIGLYDFRAILRDTVDMRGLPSIDGETTRWLRPAELPFVGNGPDDEEAILFMDELNSAAPAMQAACFQLVLERRVGEHILKPGIRIVAAGNPRRAGMSRQQIDHALSNRFAHLSLVPDATAWLAWATEAKINPCIRAFVAWRSEFLHRMPAQGDDCPAFPSPRQWVQVAKVFDAAPKALRVPMTAALVGQDAANHVAAFLPLFEEMPPLASILRDFDAAPLPPAGKPGIAFAVVVAIADHVRRDQLDGAARYVRRFENPDYESLLMTLATARDPSMANSAAHIAWQLRAA